MQYLAFGCVLRAIGEFPYDDATNSVKLFSTVLGVLPAPSTFRFVWVDERAVVSRILLKAEGE
jgi:hypothetical protein